MKRDAKALRNGVTNAVADAFTVTPLRYALFVTP